MGTVPGVGGTSQPGAGAAPRPLSLLCGCATVSVGGSWPRATAGACCGSSSVPLEVPGEASWDAAGPGQGLGQVWVHRERGWSPAARRGVREHHPGATSPNRVPRLSHHTRSLPGTEAASPKSKRPTSELQASLKIRLGVISSASHISAGAGCQEQQVHQSMSHRHSSGRARSAWT